ncbi:MAG TPA: lysylphosphatidylglycerol synthase transmembrane domain-containing protein [Bacteroidia bacterium]|nr:lysylphosphatidylglycerol synthase transmembrane domain-containing protein [Bacteroidia bacterium]
MKPKTKSIIQFIVVFALGILLVWVAYNQVATEKEKIISAFTNANYFWVFISALIGFLSHIVRAYRWKYLLEPLGYKTSFINASAAVFIGYFGNYAFRLGEIMRPSILDRYEKVPFQIGFGTVITERIVDTILLFVILGLTLLFQFSELIGLSSKYIFTPIAEKFEGMSGLKMIILSMLGLGAIVAFLLFRKKMAGKLKGKFGSIIKGFLDGLSSVRKIKNMWAFAGLSVLIWAMYFYSSYTCLFALPETSTLGHKECLTIMLLGTLGIVFTPGGLGAYHLIVANVLMFYGLSKAESAAFPWLVWTSQLIVITIMGLLSLALLPIINRKKNAVS